MKKNYFLISLLLISVMLQGQTLTKKIVSPDVNYFERLPERTPEPTGSSENFLIAEKAFPSAHIGTTQYDLQTYGAMSKRIYTYPDGTIGATWMMALQAPDWPDRRTGYNYYNGTAWGLTTPLEESGRTGWPSYAPLGANGEIVVAHYLNVNDWVLLFNKRANKGTDDWTEFMLDGPAPGIGIVWADMVTNGPNNETIHILARTWGGIYMGQDGALLYSRSSDGGLTWDIQNHFFNELGPGYFVDIRADEYAWAQPLGDTIGFAVGFGPGHSCIMKSFDNGDTWQFVQVYECPYYPSPGFTTPTFGAGDGTLAMSFDKGGNAHVVFGRMRYVYDDAGDLFYYPATEGLIYWNETMAELDSTIISSYTLDNLELNGNLIGWIPGGISTLLDFPSYYCALTSHPQIAIDHNNRIFVVYSSITADDNGIWNYRRIFGNSSNDGGLTWNGMVNLNTDLIYIFSECIFPAMSPNITNNKFHFLFQQDGEPGIFVWTEEQAQPTSNFIIYMDMDTYILTGIKPDRHAKTGLRQNFPNFPNPFTSHTWFEISIDIDSPVSMLVYDVTGKLVHKVNYGTHNRGNIRFRFENERLTKGIYFYTISTNHGSLNGKMMVN